MYKFTDELIEEYREGRKQLENERNEYKQKIAPFVQIMNDSGEKTKKKKLLSLSIEEREQYHFFENEIKIIGSMISDMVYAIDWMEKGKEPGNRREISRRSVYQRTELWGEVQQAAMFKFRNEEAQKSITDEEKRILDEIYNNLSERQYDAVCSILAKGNTYEETARYMGITRSSVQYYVNEGLKKINHILKYGSQITLI